MSLYDDLLKGETLAAVKTKILGFAEAAGLKITNWIVGGVGEQLYQTSALSAFSFTSVVAKAVRGFASLATSTDPGDVDDFDSGNVSLPPAAGFLSAFGKNTFGTTRGEKTFATGFATFNNSLGQVARTFGPNSLVYTWTVLPPAGTPPTYRNAPDATIYTNPGGTVTVAAGATITIPVVAEEAGARSSASAGALSLTTALVGVSGTNAAAIVGSDRESASLYRARCQQAPARISLGAPSAAYAYLAAKNLDGTPLKNASGGNVAITRTYVSQASDTGIVNAYFASDAGAAAAADVTAANDNIEKHSFAVPDAIAYTGQTAIVVAISMAGTAKYKAAAGLTVAAMKQAIVDALTAAFKVFPIGGMDQVAGAGVIYTKDLQAIAAKANAALYDVTVTTPAAASTALPLGRVATLTTTVNDWTVTEAP